MWTNTHCPPRFMAHWRQRPSNVEKWVIITLVKPTNITLGLLCVNPFYFLNKRLILKLLNDMFTGPESSHSQLLPTKQNQPACVISYVWTHASLFMSGFGFHCVFVISVVFLRLIFILELYVSSYFLLLLRHVLLLGDTVRLCVLEIWICFCCSAEWDPIRPKQDSKYLLHEIIHLLTKIKKNGSIFVLLVLWKQNSSSRRGQRCERTEEDVWSRLELGRLQRLTSLDICPITLWVFC